MVARQAHNLKMAVRIGPPQQIQKIMASSYGFLFSGAIRTCWGSGVAERPRGGEQGEAR
jgi:hypothetical protein